MSESEPPRKIKRCRCDGLPVWFQVDGQGLRTYRCLKSRQPLPGEMIYQSTTESEGEVTNEAPTPERGCPVD